MAGEQRHIYFHNQIFAASDLLKVETYSKSMMIKPSPERTPMEPVWFIPWL